MMWLRPLLFALVSVRALAAEPSSPPVDAKLTELRKVTSYDAKAPLDLKTVRMQQRGDITVTELTYASPKGGPVPAYLVTPPGKGPFPAVLFQHWGQGTKTEFLDEAVSLAHSGVVSLLVDAPHVRPEPWRRDVSGPVVYDTFVQMLMDLRRGVDLLTSRPDVDSQRLAYVGHSLGATVGGALAGAEPRLRAFVLMTGIGNFSNAIRETEGPNEKKLHDAVSQERFDTLVRNMETLDGAVGVRNAAPAALFFQYGRSDAWVTYPEARAYIDAAREPKLFKFYEGGHELSEAARRDRAQWLRAHLGFGEVPGYGLPTIANPTVADAKSTPLPEFAKLRPVITVPGMEEVQPRRGLTYTSAGGREYKLDLYIPDVASRMPVPAPVIVLVHGLLPPAVAAQVRDMRPFSNQARWLAAHGYVVAVPELGSPITGPAQEQWFTDVPALQKRVEATLAFLRREAATYRLDADHMGLLVMSGGGLWGVTPALQKQPPPGLRCVAAWYPMLDAPGQPKGTLPREALAAVDAKKALPLLVVRAGRDSPALNTALDAFVKDAKGKGASLTLVELPEAHHAFDLVDDVESSRDAMRQTALFFEQSLLP
ncbi:dienelactone hydrolase family protein [Pyxidicoccus parkwayensis]|uniref:Dienelactone hydrolase family protein n=1 Tax=Pyxidicoccus parkwayensis TaxID=2813578 RepID=A0ABX7NMF6_9BACT|nr:dienelactone hydrolase family protein [Pyxidicoccus parkwaysis]QSQ18712.1 dienelactone hydrolase family protein [Pyxidicoccus parkwaysis]